MPQNLGIAFDTLYWTGQESIDWFSPCNWDKLAVPDLTKYVVVPGGTTFQPSIQNDTARCKELFINSDNGAVLTVDGLNNGFLRDNP